MTVALVGELALWVALLLTAWGTVVTSASVPLARSDLALSGRRAGHAATLFILLALLALFASFLRLDFGLRYVQAHGGVAATPGEIVGALWAGPGGALLVVALSATALGSAATFSAPAASASIPRALVLLLASGVLLTVLAFAMPFDRSSWAAADGLGLAPDRRHWTMLLLLPLWALGTVMAAMSAGAAAAAALGGRSEESRWAPADRWMAAAWRVHLGVLLLALWWSYHRTPEPGGWFLRAADPIALLAWFAMAAAIHLPGRLRARGVRGRTALMVLPCPLLLAGPLFRPEGSWDPLHAIAHEAAGAAWLALIAGILMIAAYVVARSSVVSDAGPRAAVVGRSLGARLAHVGFVLALGGVLAGGLRQDRQLMLAPAQAAIASDVRGREWRVVFQGLSIEETRAPFGAPRSREVLFPLMLARNGHGHGLIVPEVREYVDALGRPTSAQRPIPAIVRGVLADIVVFPDSVVGERAAVTVSFVPLPGLLWVGGLAMLVGGTISARALRTRGMVPEHPERTS